MAQTFEAQVELEFSDLEKAATRLQDAIENAIKGGVTMTEAMQKKFDIMKKRASELKTLMANASSEADFTEAREAMQVLNKDAARLANHLLRVKNVPALDAAKIRQASREMNTLARAQENMSQATIRTSLASQNVVRIIQDAPFGMFGIANNIEQMAESLARLKTQTGSVGGALKATFMPLITGPMAFPFLISLITAFTLSWDKLAAGIDKAKVALGLMTEAQAEFNKEMKKIEEQGVKDLIAGLSEDELFFALENVEEKTGQLFQRMADHADEFQKRHGFSLAEATEAQQKFEELSSAQNQGNVAGIQTGVKMGGAHIPEQIRERAKAFREVSDELKIFNSEMEKLNEAEDRIQNRQRLDSAKFELRQILGLPDFGDETGDEKKTKDAFVKREQLIIDAMSDGLDKRIRQIKLNGHIERKEIEKEFNNNTEMIALSRKKEEALIAQERADFVADMEGLVTDAQIDAAEKGFEREMARIKVEFTERRELVKKEFGNDQELMDILNAAEEQAMENARAVRARKIKEANDKQLAADARDAAKRKEARKKQIAEETQILIFGVQEQAMKVRAAINQDDPFQAQIDTANLRANERLSIIRTRQMQIADEVDAGIMNRKRANAELARLGAEEIAIEKETADAVEAIHRQKKAMIMSTSQQIFGNMSAFFGDMNTLTAKEGEKGLEETKKFLFAQAVAEAIAAGISAYQGWLSMKGLPMPLRIAAAASSMAMITARLMASARRIKQIGKNSSVSATSFSGGFTQLNNAVTGGRIAAFQQQQRTDLTRTDNTAVLNGLNRLNENVTNLSNRPINLQAGKITYDDRTAAHILTKGTEFNQRHTGKISGATVGD